jgi:L-lactate dehydrogenase complex protein LldG
MSARDAVIGRVRHALKRPPEQEEDARAAVADRLGRAVPNPIPARGQLDREGRVRLFAELASAVMAEVERVEALTDVPAAVAAYLRRHNLPQRIALAPEPFLDGARWESQPLLRIRRDTAVASDATGVTLAVAGVAETGTLVLASAVDRPMLLAFLPETSIVVLPADWIEGSYEQAWTRVLALPGGVPRSVNLVTGPSRTADIAQKLELGAHGPKRLLVLVVERLPG